MDLNLKGKTALVCAASRGFGKAVALRLADEGVLVAMCARGEEALLEAARDVDARAQQAGNGTTAVLARAADVTDQAAMAAFVQEINQKLGSVDLLLINAGGPPAGRFADLTAEQWQDAYRLNLASAVEVCRLVLPGMMERHWGRIVQVTSVSVKQPVENLMLSSVIRPAAHALVRCLAEEAADQFAVKVQHAEGDGSAAVATDPGNPAREVFRHVGQRRVRPEVVGYVERDHVELVGGIVQLQLVGHRLDDVPGLVEGGYQDGDRRQVLPVRGDAYPATQHTAQQAGGHRIPGVHIDQGQDAYPEQGCQEGCRGQG